MDSDFSSNERNMSDDFTALTKEEMEQAIFDRAAETSARTGIALYWIVDMLSNVIFADEDNDTFNVNVSAANFYGALLTVLSSSELTDHAERISLTVIAPSLKNKDGQNIAPWPEGSSITFYDWCQSEVPLRSDAALEESDIPDFSSISSNDLHNDLLRLINEDEEYDDTLDMGWKPSISTPLDAMILFIAIFTNFVRELPEDAVYTPGFLVVSLFDNLDDEDEPKTDGIIAFDGEPTEPYKRMAWSVTPMNLIPTSDAKEFFPEFPAVEPGFQVVDEIAKIAASCDCGECVKPLTVQQEDNVHEKQREIIKSMVEYSVDEGHFVLVSKTNTKDGKLVSGQLEWIVDEGDLVLLDDEDMSLVPKESDDEIIGSDPVSLAAMTFCGYDMDYSRLILYKRNTDGTGIVMVWLVSEGKITPVSADLIQQSTQEIALGNMLIDQNITIVDAFDIELT